MVRGGSDISKVLKGLDRLQEAVGDGVISMEITMDQRYARYQHERMDLRHPGGGKDHYLSDPLFDHVDQIMRDLADAAITPGGSRLAEEYTHQVEAWVSRSVVQTPKWWGDLPNSHAPRVIDDGAQSYTRAPKARRLTEEELELKNRWNVHPSRRNRRGRR